MTEPKKERCGACTDGYITFVTDDGHLSLRTCRKCGGYGYIKVEPLTNEEWLKQANTERLAEHLLNVWMDGAFNVNAEFGLNEAQIEQHKGYIVEWLKQPHKPKE